MKRLLYICVMVASAGLLHAQSGINADCDNSIRLCSTPSFTFNGGSGAGNVNDIPSNANISNPTTNPASTNAGCLLSGELKPQWLLISIGNPGLLEFIFGGNNSQHPQAGFYDWAMWRYSPTACAEIQGNTLPPIRCNWNGSSSGGTGIASSANQPSGSSPSNFEPPLQVNECDQFIICISNYSGVNTLVSFLSVGTASLLCDPTCLSVTNPTVCAGTQMTVAAVMSGTPSNVSYTVNPGNTSGTSSVIVINQPVNGASYTVVASGLTHLNVPFTRTAVATVGVKPQPTVSPTFTNSTCTNTFNAFDLKLGFLPVSATPGYTINWSPVPNVVGSSAQSTGTGGINAGLYNATVVAQGGCSVVTSVSISPPPIPASISLSPAAPYVITCYQPTLTVAALNPSYNYTWSNGLLPVTSDTARFNSNQTGTWTITSLNPQSGCTATRTISIALNTVVPSSAITPTHQTINCNLSSITTITASALSPSVNIAHYFFSPMGGSVVINNLNPTYQPGGVGEYTHYLVNMTNGCSTRKTFSVESSMGFPTFSLTSSAGEFTLGCTTRSAIVVNIINGQTSPPGGAVSYTLLSPASPSTTPATSLSFVSTYTISSPGTWTAITKDNVSLCESRAPFTVLAYTFAPPLDTVIIPSQILNCELPKVTLRAQSSNTNVSYVWSFPGTPGSQPGDSISVGVKTLSPTNTLVANYTITLTDNVNTCRNTSVIPIFQNLFPPNALISNGGTPSLTCITNTIMLSNASTSGIQGTFFPKNMPVIGFHWKGPSPQLDMLYSTSYVAYMLGTYTLQAKDLNNGCTSFTTIVIGENRSVPLVNPVNPADTAVLDCGQRTATLIPDVLTPTANLTYSWTVPPGTSVNGFTVPALTPDKPGLYRVLLTDKTNGCSSQANMAVIVGTLTAKLEIEGGFGYAPFDATINNISLSSTGNESITSAWSLGNGNFTVTPGVGPLKIHYDAPGVYTVILYATKGACQDSTMGVITVEVPSRLEIPNIFTPNGDGVNDLFFLHTANLTGISMEIADRWGRKVYVVESTKGNVAWDGKDPQGLDVPDGVYYYTLTAEGRDSKPFSYKGQITVTR
jgi:gliding motility-associated-like protein